MSSQSQIIATKRHSFGKGAARSLRKSGKIPVIIYGNNEPPLSVEIEERTLAKVFNEPGIYSRLLEIMVNEEKINVLTREIQMHPISDKPIHCDMLRVSKSSIVSVAVPVEFINENLSPGLKIGGVLNIVRYEVELNCPADNIPNKITVDLNNTKIGDSIHISSITLPDNVTPTISDRDFTVATIQSPGGGLKNEDEEEASLTEDKEGETSEEPQKDTSKDEK